jgi:hypothetical protein
MLLLDFCYENYFSRCDFLSPCSFASRSLLFEKGATVTHYDADTWAFISKGKIKVKLIYNPNANHPN